jgi:hypothetical protein
MSRNDQIALLARIKQPYEEPAAGEP